MKNQVVDWKRAAEAKRREAFIDAMSRTAAGVSIATTNGPAGRFGLTVSSMTSVSADPPLLLVCINRKSVAHNAMLGNGRFAVSVVATHQHEIAATFAGRATSGRHYEFDAADWQNLAGLPRLRDCSASFVCGIVSSLDFGTHSIIVGRVENSQPGEVPALLYANRRYGRPARLTGWSSQTGTNSVLEHSSL